MGSNLAPRLARAFVALGASSSNAFSSNTPTPRQPVLFAAIQTPVPRLLPTATSRCYRPRTSTAAREWSIDVARLQGQTYENGGRFLNRSLHDIESAR